MPSKKEVRREGTPRHSRRTGGSKTTDRSNQTCQIILSRRNSQGKKEEAEISVPNTRNEKVMAKIYDQITRKFPASSLQHILPANKKDANSSYMAEYLNDLLVDLNPSDSYYSGSYSYSYSEDAKEALQEVEYRTEWIEHKIEVPKIELVEKIVEIPQIEEVTKYKTVSEIQEMEVPVYREVVKPEIQEVIREVQVPGKIIEVKKDVIVEKPVVVDNIHDHNVPVSIAQTIQPIMQLEIKNSMRTTAYVYEPVLREVDVYVPMPIEVPMDGPFRMEPEYHRIIADEISCPQFNSICLALNKHLLDGKTLEAMKRMEDAVKRVNPEMEGDLLVVRHNEGGVIDKINMIKKEEKYPGKVCMSADATVAGLKANLIHEKIDAKVRGHLGQV